MFNYSKTFSGYSINDLQAARDFYSQKLGVSVEETPEGLVLRPTGGQEIFLYQKPDHMPATFTVLNFMVPDIDAGVDELTASGIKFEQYDFGGYGTDEKGVLRNSGNDPGPKGIAWFKDPAGNVISVLQEK